MLSVKILVLLANNWIKRERERERERRAQKKRKDEAYVCKEVSQTLARI